MKLNLPSTWTQEKIASLIFLTWLSANRVSAGQAFKNCLVSKNFPNIYNQLLNFPFASNNVINGGVDLLSLCCDGSQCSYWDLTSSCTSLFICNKIGKTIFCNNAHLLCGGIVGDTLITSNNFVGSSDFCSNNFLSNIANYSSITEQFGLNQGYAYWYCPGDPVCANLTVSCNWDNGGWTCFGYDNKISNIIINNDCFLQWTASWPGSSSLNPSIFTYSSISSTTNILSTTTTKTSIITTSIVTTTSSPIGQDGGLSAGAIAGISIASSIVGIPASLATIYLCFKKICLF